MTKIGIKKFYRNNKAYETDCCNGVIYLSFCRHKNLPLKSTGYPMQGFTSSKQGVDKFLKNKAVSVLSH